MLGYCIGSTISNKELNQDAYRTFKSRTNRFQGVVIADGLGSFKYSEVASRFCCDFIGDQLSKTDDIDDIDFESLFEETQDQLKTHVEQNKGEYGEDVDLSRCFATTLICVLETESQYHIAYVGNGAIWIISGAFNTFRKSRHLPWNISNLLIPHTLEENGKEALFGYISLTDNSKITPTVLSLSKDKKIHGEAILICTDGISSNDQLQVGTDDNDKIWIEGESKIKKWLDDLSKIFTGNEEIESSDIQALLERYLNELKDNDELDDDSTCGLILSNRFLAYQRQRNQEVKHEGD
jgi:serine/threonine protein phosphatase PrpC